MQRLEKNGHARKAEFHLPQKISDFVLPKLHKTAANRCSLFQNKQMDDTSALDYKEGKDMQGIPWERLNYSRNQYREMRLRQYKNYENLTMPRDGLEKVRFLCFST